MSEVLAPAILILILMTISAIYIGKRFDSEKIAKVGMTFFAVSILIAILAVTVLSNWFAFVDSPEYCWRGSGRYGFTNRGAVPWEECQLPVSITAIVLGLILVGIIYRYFIKRRSHD